MRRLLAVLAAVPLLALTLGAGTASAAPAHQAAIVRPAGVTGNPYWAEWGPDPAENCWYKNYRAVLYNAKNQGCYGTWPSGGGYELIYEDVVDSSGLFWHTDGYCVGWNQTDFKVEIQPCTGDSWQLWAGTGTSPDLIWNKWYDANYHTMCPIQGGYTQSVITADSTDQDLFLACPETHLPPTYTLNQKWYWYTLPT